MFERMSRQFDESSVMGHSPGVDVDVRDGDEEFVVVADVPGYEKEDIDLSVADRTLTVAASREMREDTESDGGEYLHRERRHESVRRTLRLPEDVTADDATATYRNGVITVTLPKVSVDADDSRRIDVD